MSFVSPWRWEDLTLRRKGLVVLAPSVGALLLVSGSSLWLFEREKEASARVDHTVRVRHQVLAVEGSLAQAQASLRGYLLTGEAGWLAEHTAAQQQAEAGLTRLRKETADNPAQSARLAEVDERLGELLSLFDLEVRQGPGLEAASLVRDAHELRAGIARILDEVQGEEDRLLEARSATQRAWAQRISIANSLSLALGLLGGIAGTLLYAQGVAGRVEALERAARGLGRGEAVAGLPEGRDEIGRLAATLRAAADLLAERQAALQTHAAEIRDLYDRAPCGYHSLDAEGRFVEINETALAWLGYERAEVVGQLCFLDVLTAESQERFRENFPRFKAEGRIADLEFTLLRKDGSPLEVLLSASAVTDAEGRYLRSRSTTVDISARRRAEARVQALNESLESRHLELVRTTAQAQRASQTKSEFLANMSHELRTPLNAVIGFAELMHDGKVGPVSPEHREYLGDILASARHLLKIINDVLDLAKVEAGRLEFRPEPMVPAQAAREVIGLLRTLAAERRVVVREDLERAPAEASLDPSRFKQVLYNYLSNALKFTPERGRVTVRLLSAPGDALRLEVEDTGVGIGPEDQGRLFQEFQQLHGPGPRPDGTGLGLALTRRIVEAQGGKVGVDSMRGQGSTFSAELPRIARAEPAAEPTIGTPEADAGASRGTKRLLVVEDDPRDRRWLLEALQKAGYAVDPVADGAAAVSRAQDRAYDAVILDLLLPDRSGWDVVSALRRSPLNRETPVLVVSVVADHRRGAAFRVQAYLTKPVEPAQILGALRAAGVSSRPERPVLVVDDDPRDLRLVEAALRGSGYRTLAHTRGSEALAAATAEPPAAIVLDLCMPEMDGFEFLTRFRASPQGREVPVVVWTGLDLSAELRARLRDDARRIVAKQEGSSPLLEELEELLGSADRGAREADGRGTPA